MIKSSLENNISLFYLISCLGWARFFVPVLALFYVASNVSLYEFSIIMSIFSLTILLLEIPSGVFADIVGKKVSLIIGAFCFFTEVFIFAFFNGFWMFLIAKVISGFGVSFMSGANSALLFDTLKKLEREKEHKKISGDIQTYTSIVMAFVFVIGGVLFSINPKFPAFVSLPFIFLQIILLFLVVEPYKINKKDRKNLSESYLHLKEGLVFFWKNRFIRFLGFFAFIVGAALSIILSLSSAYYELILIPVILIGFFNFLGNLVSAYASKKADFIEENIGEKNSILLIGFIVLFCVSLMSLTIDYFGFIFLIVFMFAYGFYYVITNHYINHHAKTSHRATILSIRSFFANLGVFIFFPIIGFFQINKGLNFAYEIFAIFILIYFLSLFLVFRKKNIFD